ncbi:hypothetical protein J2S74_001434 [Evansella vedderi]|uniref:Inner membrane protein YgaP-like transmembrane domain-containing protein n=1 Tax=Evansella vedderi TaxID=38282 RepID=A0ABT9ZS50_9BACI|nr:DUF2892 domain-containing protein [Evansella vedderi]MDQ0254061.1 hypothetical protein [Evansella vedderi]
MRQNIGLINAVIRITCGLTIVAWATSKLVRRPYDSMPLICTILGAMKVAEGITRFCPLTYLFEESEYYYEDEDYEYEDEEYDDDDTAVEVTVDPT